MPEAGLGAAWNANGLRISPELLVGRTKPELMGRLKCCPGRAHADSVGLLLHAIRGSPLARRGIRRQ